MRGFGTIDQRSLMSYVATTKKCLPRIFVRPSVRHITDTKNPCVLVLTRCHVTGTRTNTNPNDTEANAAGRSVRACVARKSKS